MTPGQECVQFLNLNFKTLDEAEEWIAKPPLPPGERRSGKGGQRGKVFRSRVLGLKRSGNLTVAEYFKLVAWHRHLKFKSGFLTDPIRCN